MKNILVTKNKCCGCSACQDVCPKNAITMVEDKEGLLYPVIDENKCIDCGMCCNVCPSINVKTKESLLKAYAAYNKNEKIRLKSSSGGIFTLIAEDNGTKVSDVRTRLIHLLSKLLLSTTL